MKKFLCVVVTMLAAAAAVLCSCAGGEIDYADFISERRFEVYMYTDDNISVKVHVSSRETPYLSDGYKGEMGDLCEVFIKFADQYSEVDISLGGNGGEMSYMSVTDSFYISFSGALTGDDVPITLTCDGEEIQITAPSVMYSGVISPEEALASTKDYDSETFEALTNGKNFEGEIYVRLLADEGKCYYYVGVIDRSGNTSAYLVDGESGNIIAERKL